MGSNARSNVECLSRLGRHQAKGTYVAQALGFSFGVRYALHPTRQPSSASIDAMSACKVVIEPLWLMELQGGAFFPKHRLERGFVCNLGTSSGLQCVGRASAEAHYRLGSTQQISPLGLGSPLRRLCIEQH